MQIRRRSMKRQSNQIPLAILPFLLPSRYVPSDRLAAFARTEFGSLLPGHKRVNAICGWIYDHLEYRLGPALKRRPPTRPFSSGLAFAAIFRISQLHSAGDLGYPRASSVATRTASSLQISTLFSKPILMHAGGCSTRPARRILMVLFGSESAEMPPKSLFQHPLACSSRRG
jgi:hypothetical protein